MAIKVQYGDVGDLAGLAQAAGAGAARQRREAGDLAFTQMILSTQSRNAEVAARIRAQGEAFALQRAAADRRAGTPTSRIGTSGPIVSEVIRAKRQQDQFAQIDSMWESGQINSEERERLRLNAMTGRTLAGVPKVAKPQVSVAQKLNFWRGQWTDKIQPVDDQIRHLQREILIPMETTTDGDPDPELLRQDAQRTRALGIQLQTLNAKRSELLNQRDQEWGELQTRLQVGAPIATGTARAPDEIVPVSAPTSSLDTPIPLPARREDMRPKQVYRMRDGTVGRWDGNKFTETP